MKSSKGLIAVVALFALSTCSIVTPSGFWNKSSIKNLTKNNNQETPSEFIDRLVVANLSLIQDILFDEYSDAIVLNILKEKSNKNFVNFLMSNIKQEFKGADQSAFSALLANSIEKNIKKNTEKNVVCDLMKLLRLIG